MATIFKDIILYETYGENISVGDVLYKSTGTGADSARDAGKLYKLEVSNPDRSVYYGIARDAGLADDSNKKIVTGGRFNGYSGLTAGLPVYADPLVAGAVTQVKPSSKAQVIGIATSADEVSVNAALGGSFGAGEGSGGVGGVDILFVQDFETAALGDFTQTGLLLESVSPLSGGVSAKLIHDDTINQSFKQIVDVDQKFRNRNITLKLNIKSEASDGNVVMNVTDETNAIALVTSEALPISNETGGDVGFVSFNIPENCLSLSYEVVALPEAGLPETIVDDVIAELSVVSLLTTSVEVPIITEWQSYTPTIGLTGGSLTPSGRYRQVGESIEFEANYKWSSIFTGGTPSVSSPDGLLIDLSKVPGGQPTNVETNFGEVELYDSSANQSYKGVITYGSDSSFLIKYIFNATGNAYPTTTLTTNVSTTLPFAWAANDEITIKGRFPAQGLTATKSSSIPLAQSIIVEEADSVLYAAGNAGQAITANVTDIPFNFVSNKGHNIIWNGNSFTVTENGVYDLSVHVQFTSSSSRRLDLYEDGVNVFRLATSDFAVIFGSYARYFTTGKTYSLRVDTAGGTLSNTTFHNLSITYQGSLKQLNPNPNSKITIPTSELRMEGASSRGSTATTIVRFDSVAKLRGDAFEVLSDSVLGTRIVMKKKGRLDVSASAQMSASGTSIGISVNHQDLTSFYSADKVVAVQTAAAGHLANASSLIDVSVGDVIRIVSSSTPTGSQGNSLNLSFQEQDISVSVTNTLPQFSDSDSMIRVLGGNGRGSTATSIRRFSSVLDNIGSGIAYQDSPTDGATFTVLEDGIYSISYQDSSSTSALNFGISKNSTQLTTDITGINSEDSLGSMTTGQSSYDGVVNWSGILSKGDVIRAHCSSSANGTLNPNLAQFTISKVGKPNVTGVDVTPFVNIPQPEIQQVVLDGAGINGTTNLSALTKPISIGGGIFSLSTEGITVLKRCEISTTVYTNRPSDPPSTSISVNGVVHSACVGRNVGGSASDALKIKLNVGDKITFSANGSTSKITALAESLSDQIVTASDSFSTDSANLTYAPSSLYTLSTLKDAPVGTFITFTYAANTNTRTQTTTAPTQTTADMNVNGLRIFTRGYTTASTALNPSVIAIQIGKGLKGKSIDLYKNVNKSVSGSIDYLNYGSTGAGSAGLAFKDYDETTGVLLIDAGYQNNTATVSNLFFSDATIQNNGYLVVNASKSPTMLGFGIASDTSARIGESRDQFITPATLRSGLNANGEAPVYAARAWVNFNGTGTVAIRNSGNVSSITDLGTGTYQVNFETPMEDRDYAIVSTVGAVAGATAGRIAHIASATPVPESCRIGVCTDTGSAIDTVECNVVIFR
jgi:hypothetical protein